MLFKNVEFIDKRFCLVVDVSGLMNVLVMGILIILVCDVVVVMMMVIVCIEKNFEVVVFLGGFRLLNIKVIDSLENVLDECVFFLFCGIDCFCFMMYVMENKKEFDVFIVYMDLEIYFGNIYFLQVLVNYCLMFGIFYV